jgi:hypothetical protein
MEFFIEFTHVPSLSMHDSWSKQAAMLGCGVGGTCQFLHANPSIGSVICLFDARISLMSGSQPTHTPKL